MPTDAIGFTTLLLLLTLFTQRISGFGVFELKLKSFSNPAALKYNSTCCSGSTTSSECTTPCRTFFRICLKHYMQLIDPNPPCTFGSLTTGVFNEDSIQFTENHSHGIDNPIQFPFEFAWPRTFSLIIEAWHDTTLNEPTQGSPRELISRLATQNEIPGDSIWRDNTFQDNHTSLSYSIRVQCDKDYFGDICAEYCRARDDNFGHYTCSENGTKLCLAGWKGPYCDQAICLSGCNAEHGYCDKPNECKCRLGHEGIYCDSCVRHPGCVHGSCSKPWECNCEDGWGGIFCNEDLNFCTHHKPCKNGGLCENTGHGSYTCSCPPSFTGTNCEKLVDDCNQHPCENGGSCMETATGYSCQCPHSYYGRHCESSAESCSDDPCENGATCTPHTVNGYKCTCADGYTGDNCEKQIDECSSHPCQNGGRCIDEENGFRCVCLSGFRGERCQEDYNDCSLQPCLNGARCVDRINDFICECTPGFAGKLCQENVDDCYLHPCANGGTCHDLVNGYQCTCAPGFSGHDCRSNLNECESNPCFNGGTCVDMVNDFQCNCQQGYFGYRCELVEGVDGIPAYRPTDAVSNPPTTSLVANVGSLKDSQGVTMKQLLLIICLGVGIPIVVIIVIIILLLLNHRRRSGENGRLESRQNEINQSTMMNNHNKVVDSNHFNSIPTNSYKLTNEERRTNLHHKNDVSNISHKTVNKTLNARTITTISSSAPSSRSKDTVDDSSLKKCSKVVNSSNNCIEIERQPSPVVQFAGSSDFCDVRNIYSKVEESEVEKTASSTLHVDSSPLHLPHYNDDVLATEV